MRSVAWIACALFVSGPAVAQQTPEPSRLRWGVGAGIVASPRPYVGARGQTFAIPVLRMEYERWFVQGIRGGYQLFSAPRWTVNAFAQARFQGLDPKDSPFLEGMEARKKSMDGGVEVVYRGRPLGFRAAAMTDVLGKSKGQVLTAQAISGAPVNEKLLVLVGFGPRWETARRVDYYYGVRPEEATSTRAAYTADGTLSWDLALSASYRPASRWSVFALMNHTFLGNGIRQSPTVERNSVSSFVLLVTRDF